MNNLRTDSVPLGFTPKQHPQDSEEEEEEEEQERPQPCPRNQTNSIPRVMNIIGSKGVQIGPVYHNVTVNPKPKVDPRDMPTKKAVNALMTCHRQIEERDKYIVSEHLGDAWRSLGRAMNYSSGQLENISADFNRNADRASELLSQWHDRESSRATIAKLAQLIVDVKAYHVLKYLKPVN